MRKGRAHVDLIYAAPEAFPLGSERDEHPSEYHFAGLQKDLEGNFLPMIFFQELQI